mgnify:CR=1 FL=1
MPSVARGFASRPFRQQLFHHGPQAAGIGLAGQALGDAAAAVDALLADGVVAGVPFSRLDPGAGMDDVLLVAATETTTTQDIQTFAQALAGRTA